MISASQKAPLVLLGLVLAFSFSVDAAQLQTIKSQSLKHQDLQSGDDAKANDGEEEDDTDNDDDDDRDDSTSNKSPVYEVKSIKTAKSEHATTPNKHLQENVRLELVSNLRKQSHLKEQIQHLTNETASDEEIEDSAKLVANETESVEMANMLSNMWKEMRMFDMPAYEEHIKEQLHHLKEDEEVLEAKLNGKHAEDKLKGEDGKGDQEKENNVDEEDDKKDHEDQEDEEEKHKKQQGEDKAVKVGNEGNASIVNFWKMSRASQKSVFISSLVYFISGALAAVLFKQMRSKYFKLEDSLDGHPNKKTFSFPIFGCLGAGWKLCALGFCCPCLAWANTVERRLKVSFWKAFVAFFGLLLLHAYTMGMSSIALIILGVFYRQKLRESYDIDSLESGSKSTVAMDFLLWCFCQPCVIIQEAREETTTHEGDQKRDQPSGP